MTLWPIGTARDRVTGAEDKADRPRRRAESGALMDGFPPCHELLEQGTSGEGLLD